MTSAPTYIVTKNYLRIQKKYLTDVVLPQIAQLTKKQTKTYSIAGKYIVIHFYSSTLLAKMEPALRHMEVTNTEPKANLTVHVWDSLSTGIDSVSPWSQLGYFYDLDTNVETTIDDAFLGVYMNGEQTLNLYDQDSATAYFWIHDANDILDWIAAAPLRTIFHWFLSQSDIHLMHGAVVSHNNRGLLLTAKGGSGKSTTALSCLMAGLDYIADDYVGVALNTTITAHSLYNSAKMTAATRARFPELDQHIWNRTRDAQEKAIIFLSDVFPQQLISHAPLHAIMIPRITEERTTRIVPATKIQAMLAMIPTTLFQLPLASSNQVPQLKKIIDTTPCYFLELGTNVAEIPAILKAHLA